MASEKYILTQKEMHLGYIKETFGRGAILEYDSDKRQLMVDGRKFDEFRDLEILKRQSIKNPDNPWIVEYTDELFAHYKGVEALPSTLPQPKQQPGTNMKVVQSDSDLIDEIDISDTKVTDASRMAAEAKAKADANGGKMEIIRGDETVEDRIARLDAEGEARRDKKKGNMDVIAAKVQLKNSQPAKMEIVHDDSLGAMGGSSASALNAGAPVMSREAVESKTEEAKLITESRKREVEMNREKHLSNEGLATDDEFEVAPAVATSDGVDSAPADISPEAAPSEAEVLKAENATLQKQMAEMQKQMAALAPQAAHVATSSESESESESEVEAAVEAAEAVVSRVPVTASEELA